MNTRRMSKSIAAHDSLVGLHWHIHQARHHAARRYNAVGVDICVDTEFVMRAESHHHFLKRSIAGAFTDTVDSHLCLTRTCDNTGYGIGSRHTHSRYDNA